MSVSTDVCTGVLAVFRTGCRTLSHDQSPPSDGEVL